MRRLLIVAALWTVAADLPVPPREAPGRMTLPDGFRATLFAGEPDVVQPIALTFDPRGRLWVAECLSYPKWLKDPAAGRDRITIYEDTDGDGTFDRRKVFTDRVANLSGLEYGHGGVWVCATPHLLFIPDRNGDDVPDGPPEVVLDGWDLTARHNVFNGIIWGPDGWLWGCNGILSNSRVGPPGTPDDKRTALNCGVWRYHPVRKTFELVATGTTNPWGLDFDDHGQAFITNCVIHHLWHVVPGSHFRRMFGQDFNPHWYELMESCADHLHWAGGSWQSSRGAVGGHDAAGGGHAHSGCMVYLGDNWPDRYRNGVFTCNIHGSRVNHDVLVRQQGDYVAQHGKDFLLANDPWFRGIAMRHGPDGAAYVSDWTDTGECHNYDKVHVSGRIYKVSYGKPRPWSGDLAKLSDAELVQLQLHRNDWFVRQARRLLHERAAAGTLSAAVTPALQQLLEGQTDITRRLRALWALHATGTYGEQQLLALLNDPADPVRAWAVRLLLEGGSPNVRALAALARKTTVSAAQLELTAALQRVPVDQRWELAEALLGASVTLDRNRARLLWYGVEPLVAADPARARALLSRTKVPLVREYLARRLTLLDERQLPPLVRGLDSAMPEVQRDVLRGIQEALAGRREVPRPDGWTDVRPKLTSTIAEVGELALRLSAVFGEPEALAVLRRRALDRTLTPPVRRSALEALVFKRLPGTASLLHELLTDPAVRGTALRGLAEVADDGTPAKVLEHYPRLTDEEKAEAVATLTSRPAYALALLDAVAAGRVPRRDLSPYVIRQLLASKDDKLLRRLNTVWGAVRPASAEKTALLAKYKGLLTPEYRVKADPSRGRQVYTRACQACHRLFGEGGDIGPDLTGAQRDNLDYVLENVLDPSAVVFGDYQVVLVETRDGRVVTGIVKQETEQVLTLQTPTERVSVPKKEIEGRSRSPVSMMPEGLLATLSDEEVRDLVAYLASREQVPPRR